MSDSSPKAPPSVFAIAVALVWFCVFELGYHYFGAKFWFTSFGILVLLAMGLVCGAAFFIFFRLQIRRGKFPPPGTVDLATARSDISRLFRRLAITIIIMGLLSLIFAYLGHN